MGTLITTSIMIKLLLTSSLLALPAAVPALHSVGAVAHAPVVKSDVITPAEVSHEVAAAPIVTYAHPLGYYGKRSADAEPQAEADAYYGYGYGYGYGQATATGYRGYYAHPYAGLHYASLPVVAPAAAEAVVAERKKREADPQVVLGGLSYAAPLAAPATFATVGAVPHAPVVKNVEVTPAEVSHEVTAHTVPVAVGYHGLPYWG